MAARIVLIFWLLCRGAALPSLPHYPLDSPAGGFNYGYDPARPTFMTTIALPNGAYITNHFDSLSRLDYTALVNHLGHVLDGYGYTYDLLGQRTNIFRDLGLTTSSVAVGYDGISQIISWSAKEAGGTLRLNEQVAWAYDKSGNLLFRTNGGLIQTFNCDAANELTNITRNNVMTVSGNTPAPMISVTVNGFTAQTNGDFTFAATNLALVDGPNSFTNIAVNAYGLRTTNTVAVNLPASLVLQNDLNGNLTNDGTRSFVYNAANQLTDILVAGAWKTEFVYDGLGRRRIERDYAWASGAWSKTNDVRLVYDGYQLIGEMDTNNNVLVIYPRGLDLSGSLSGAGGIGGLLARTDANGSTYYHADGAGNVTALMDPKENMAARHMYTAFGRPVGQWGPLAPVNEMGFSSMPLHHLAGIIGYWGRPYDPNLRWLTPDPIGEAGDINLYRFVFNSPLAWVDFLGLDPIPTGASGRQALQDEDEGAQAVVNQGLQLRNDLTAGANLLLQLTPQNTFSEVALGRSLSGDNISGKQRISEGVLAAAPYFPFWKRCYAWAQDWLKARSAYGTALAGGKHAGFLKNYVNKTPDELRKAIASMEKQIAEHKDKIANPGNYIPNFDQLNPLQQQALVQSKWPGDIQRAREQINILQGILK